MLVKISKKGFQKMENLQLNRIEENLQILTTLLRKIHHIIIWLTIAVIR